jgi:hypothetical protein
LDRNGKKLLDRAVSQDEAELLSIIASLARNGTLLLVVDHPATIGALPVAVTQTKCIKCRLSAPGWRCAASGPTAGRCRCAHDDARNRSFGADDHGGASIDPGPAVAAQQ